MNWYVFSIRRFFCGRSLASYLHMHFRELTKYFLFERGKNQLFGYLRSFFKLSQSSLLWNNSFPLNLFIQIYICKSILTQEQYFLWKSTRIMKKTRHQWLVFLSVIYTLRRLINLGHSRTLGVIETSDESFNCFA